MRKPQKVKGFPIWLKRPGDRVRAVEVLRGLAALGEAGRAVGVVLAPWEEQTSSLSQRTGGVTKNKVQSGTAASRTAQLICTVESGGELVGGGV